MIGIDIRVFCDDLGLHATGGQVWTLATRLLSESIKVIVSVSVQEQLLCYRCRAVAFYCALRDVISDITARQHLGATCCTTCTSDALPVLAEAVCAVQAALSNINLMAFLKRALCSSMGEHDRSGPPIRCMTSISSDMATRILNTSTDHQLEFGQSKTCT